MRVLLVAVAVALLAPALGRAESSLRCDRGIVQIGDARLDLLAKCGTPALKEQLVHGGAVVELLEGQGAAASAAEAERWTYNFGPRQFLYVVTVDGGKVVSIERGGYGYPPELLREPGNGRVRCDASAIRVGDRKLDLIARCGSPSDRDLRWDDRPVGGPGGGGGVRNVVVESWTYDFGPQQFRAVVLLEAGVVVRVERGAYGTAR